MAGVAAMADGYIKLWRKSLTSEVYADDHLWKLWCHILLMTTWRSRFYPVNSGRGKINIAIKRGQCVFALRTWAEDLGWSKSSLDRRLKRLIAMKMVGHQPGRNHSILTIVKWDDYQGEEVESGTPSGTPNGTPAGHQRDKRKKIYQDKEDSDGGDGRQHGPPDGPPATDAVHVSMAWLRIHCYIPEEDVESWEIVRRSIPGDVIQQAVLTAKRERKEKGLPRRACLSDVTDLIEIITEHRRKQGDDDG